MQKINVQYSNKLWLDKMFRCKLCGADTLMFGCENPECKDYHLGKQKQSQSKFKRT